MESKLQISNQEKQSQMMEPLKDNEMLTLQKMRELEKEIDLREEDKKSIKDIIKIDNLELSPMLKLNEAYLVELEDQMKELSYELYTEKGLISVDNKEGLVQIDPNYIAEKNEQLGEYGSEYLIPVENEIMDPNMIKEQSLDLNKKSELEKREPTQQKENEQKEDPDEKISKMEDDLGCDITSCVEIQDENFSEEVLGHQTGHEEKYIGYSKSRNTFILIGKKGNNYDEIQDICGAQGGGEASRKTYCEYDESGRPVDIDAPSFVMTRNDGKEGALALDMHYGAICVSNLTPNDKEEGKYDSEEIRVGHSVRPTPDEVELSKEREEKAKAIQQKQKEIEELESNMKHDENKEQELDESKQELDNMKRDAQEDDDLYDWSTGRPIPRH